VIKPLSKAHYVIAPDLAGFGLSDKPPNISYNVEYHSMILNEFLDKLDVGKVDLVVHDLGGPIGLSWALQNRERIRRIIVLNTILHPVSIGVKLFIIVARIKGIRNLLTSPWGIAKVMKFGVTNKKALTDEDIKIYQAPFTTKEERKVLLKTLTDINPKVLEKVAKKLPDIDAPVRIIYGEKDPLLGVTHQMTYLKEKRPDIDLTAILNCGHFLQEDQPERLSKLLSEFLEETT
jgi:haloalkane dehalogenase